jgi:nitrile hydratase subunit beta
MNGIHDMGGMHGMGSIDAEKDEPVFHFRWEGRVYALTMAVGPTGKAAFSRYQLERIPPADYLRMSYYEKWLNALIERLPPSGLVTAAEIETGKPARGTPKATPALTAAQVPGFVARRGGAARRDGPTPRFQVGQRVRARNINPVGHTRLPRYARGKMGAIERDFGIFRLQDTDADGRSLGANPQHVYSVRFAAQELWGEQASSRDAVYVDLWEDYLERA